MKKENYDPWNRLVYYVSNVYLATKKFKPGVQHGLAEKIRRTAVSISVSVNAFDTKQIQAIERTRLYPILSSLSVLETYLQLAKQHNLLKDTCILDSELARVKGAVLELTEKKDS